MKEQLKLTDIFKRIFPVLIFSLSLTLITGCNSESQNTTQTEGHAGEEAPAEETQSEEEAASGEHSEEVHLTAEQRADLNIEVDTLQAGSANSVIQRPATVMYNLDRIAKVGPRIEAKVVRVLKDLGDNVKVGEPIAQMSSVELGKIKADYLRLKASIKKEEAHLKREQSLYEQDISSQAELLQAELEYEEAKAEKDAATEALRLYGLSQPDIENIKAGSETPLSYFYLSSPLNGRIQERDLSPGQTVGPNETPVHVANLSNVWVMIDGYEQDIPYLEEGQRVELQVRGIGTETFEGETNWVSFALEQGSRTVPVRAVIENPNGTLRAGMFGTARIFTGKAMEQAVISVDAIQEIEGQPSVFVPGDEEGSFRPVAVMLGEERDGLVEIRSGLLPGDRAVVGGAFDLKSALTAASRSADHGH